MNNSILSVSALHLKAIKYEGHISSYCIVV